MRLTTVSAPSNIALIKYMGKADPALNLPANGSLSMTLNDLCSIVEIRESGSATQWVAELPTEVTGAAATKHVPAHLIPHLRVPKLGAPGMQKVVRHHERVVEAALELFPIFGISLAPLKPVEIRTANTFPADSGIASSASSFSALTFAAALHCAADQQAFLKVWNEKPELKRAFSKISRQGSGSSCRSFEGPWVLWEKDTAAGLITPMPAMVDFVVLIATTPKPVSSSHAHHLVQTSPLWEGRVERVSDRLQSVEAALGEGDITMLSRIAWAEMWEMHSLFHTCAETFTYWEPGTLKVLKWLTPYIQEGGTEGSELTPPIVTMDAGANVHILVEAAEAPKWQKLLKDAFPEFEVLQDSQGTGPKVL